MPKISQNYAIAAAFILKPEPNHRKAFALVHQFGKNNRNNPDISLSKTAVTFFGLGLCPGASWQGQRFICRDRVRCFLAVWDQQQSSPKGFNLPQNLLQVCCSSSELLCATGSQPQVGPIMRIRHSGESRFQTR